MNKQEFISQLEQRCRVYFDSYVSTNEASVTERDELIGYAKAAVMLNIAEHSEVKQLVLSLEHNELLAA
ncbi:MAG: hypothetical protein HKN85_03405 [Gammaproteobacteria bacterium]|nr:hypothetical protein [Gammaproteobacteria bacterium]